MISNFFPRDIFLEKHWRTIVSRSVCDHFFDAQTKATTPEDVPPIITANKSCLINIYREKIYLVAVIQMEGQYPIESGPKVSQNLINWLTQI